MLPNEHFLQSLPLHTVDLQLRFSAQDKYGLSFISSLLPRSQAILPYQVVINLLVSACLTRTRYQTKPLAHILQQRRFFFKTSLCFIFVMFSFQPCGLPTTPPLPR